jgi:hypothetical protein
MKTVRMLVVFSCVLFLVLSSIPLGESKNTAKASAAQTTINETEPNNDPLSAQEIPFPAPGETVVVRGSVRASDTGTFSEDLETEFGSSGGVGAIHDWYVLNPDSLAKQGFGDGPIPFRFSVGWDSGADVDIWWGTLVDDSVLFFDGFKALGLAASLRNPETVPLPFVNAESLSIHLQPQGITVDGQPILNDGFGRALVIGIQHFDGPPANYQLSIEVGGALAKAAFTTEQAKVDADFISEFGFSRAFIDDIIVNRFRPSGPARLTAVGHPFAAFGGFPNPTGQPIRVVVFKGDSDDPLAEPPSNPTFLFDQMVPIPGTIQFFGEVIDFPINPPIDVNEGEVVYVGFEFRDPMITGALPVLNFSAVQYFRTRVSGDRGATWVIPLFEENLTGEPVAANAMIRATFESGGSAASSSAVKTKPSLEKGQLMKLSPMKLSPTEKQPISLTRVSR